MAKCLILLCAMIAAVWGQRTPFGHTVPINKMSVSDCSYNMKMADQLNMCWYHECVPDSETGFRLEARRCPLGTRLSYFYQKGVFTPCTHRYRGDHWYECSREKKTIDEPMTLCDRTHKCFNGGKVMQKDGICWCDCPEEWKGDSDCSKRKNPKLLLETARAASESCGDVDHCKAAGGCLNGGKCHNQCKGFWCECPYPYTWGKRCERFSCERDNECFNGGECRRGRTGLNEFRRCICKDGYTGYRCEIPPPKRDE